MDKRYINFVIQLSIILNNFPNYLKYYRLSSCQKNQERRNVKERKKKNGTSLRKEFERVG